MMTYHVYQVDSIYTSVALAGQAAGLAQVHIGAGTIRPAPDFSPGGSG